jgi:hypothetical protein
MITIGGYTGVNILERGLGFFSLFYVNVREYRKSKIDNPEKLTTLGRNNTR